MTNAIEDILDPSKRVYIDFVPVVPLIGQYAAMKSAQSMKNIARNATLMANVVIQSLERHRYDLCNPISDPGIGVENAGCRIRIHDWRAPEILEYSIKTYTDIKDLPSIDPYQSGRMSVVIDCEKILNEKVGDTTTVSGMLSGVLTFAAYLRGPQFLLYDVTDHPDCVHELLKYSLDVLSSYAEAQIQDGGVKLLQLFDPSVKIIGNANIEEFSLSYMKQLITHIKSLGCSVMLHSCEGSAGMINNYIELGVDIINLHGNVDLDVARRIIDDRVIFSGNITAENLTSLKANEIFAESCRCIEKAAAGGNYILSSACEVPIDTPEENIDAMVRAAHEFGGDFLQYARKRNLTD